MNDQELINLYNWVKNEDSTYEGRYSFDAFKTKMQDENYSNQLNDWVNKRKTASNKPTEVLKKKVTDESQQRNTMGLPLGGGLSGSNQIEDLAQIGQPQQQQQAQPQVLTAKGKQSYVKPTDFLDSNLIADRMKFALNEQKSQEMINKMKTSSNAQEQADADVYQEKLNQYKDKLIPEKQKIQKQVIEQARVDSQKNVLTLSNQVNDLISKGVPEDSEEISILKTKIFSEEIKPVNLVKNIFTDEETKELGSSNEDIVAYLEFIKESNPDKYNNLVQKSSSKMLGGISIGNQLTDEQRAKLVNSALEYKSEKVYADYKNLKESGVIDDVNKNFDKYSELSEKSNKIGEYISIYEKRKQDGILTPEDEEKYKVLLEKKQQIDNATKGFTEKLNKVNDVRESMDQKAAEWVKVNLALGGSLDEKQKAIDEANENVKKYPVLGRINEISKFIWNNTIVAPVKGLTDLGTMIGGNIVKAASDADEKGVERSTNAHREFMSELFDKITFETAESKTLDEKGDVIWSNVPVNTASTLATMAGLFVGGGVVSKVLRNAGAGAKVASRAGSVISSFMLFRNDYYKEYVEAGMKTEDASQYADGAAALTSLLELVSPNDAARSLLTGLNLKKKFVTESAKYFSDKGYNYAMKKGGEFLIKQVGAENVQEMSQAIGDIGVKYIANQNANKEIFNLNMEDFYREAKETVLLTTLTTGIIGGVGVKSEIKQQKKQYTFDAAMNYDAFMQNIESVDITPEEKNKVIESVAEYKKAIDSLPTEMNEDKKRDITPALVRKNKLEAIIKNDGLDDVFKDKAKADLEEVIGVIKKYNEGDKTINIANINDDPSKPLFTTQKAVEEAPVEVAEPLLTAEQTQRKTALEEALNAPENEGKDSFNIGEEIIDRTKAENELDAITQEENKAKIQALYRNKGLEQVAPTTDNGISSTNKSSMDTLKAKIQDVAKVKIIESAQRAVKTLQSVLPNFDIVVHDDEGSYNAVMADKKGIQGSAGNFSYGLNEQGNWTGRIDINLSKANARTVAHEVSHGVMLKVFGDKPALFKNFRDRIASTLKESSNKTLMDFANQYVDKKTGKLLDVTYEEYLAELTGVLAAEEGNLSATTLQKIATLINEIVSKITNGALKPFEDVKDTKQVIDFFSGISKSIRTGASIDEEINGDSEVGTFSITSKSQIKAPKASEDTRDFIKNLVEDIDIREFNGQKFVTNMYDYTNAGVTDLGNEFKINLFGGKNYVPYMMSLQNKKIGDVSNLAAFNSEENALGFIKNAQESKAKLFAPHSGTLSASWQFQQHIFSELVNLVLDKKILTSNELIESFNKTIKGNKEIQKEFSMFSKRYGKDISNFNSFESNPKKIVELLDIVNNYSPNLRKALNNNIATNTKFQEAIGVDNVDSFYNKIIDPLNKGVVGGEIIGVIKFDPSTFKVIKTKPDAIDHHPSFGWTLLAKIDGIYQPTEFHKSIEVTDSYTRYNKGGTNVSVKSDDIKKFSASNVSSSAGSQPKIAEFKVNKQLESSFPFSKSQITAWHGSPHNFDKFTTEKMGTGEGSQRFGWGLYFSGVKSIGEYYKKAINEGKGKLYEVSIFKGKKPDQYSWLNYNNDTPEQQKTKILDSFIKERNISNETLEKLKEEEPQNQEPLDALDIFEELGISNNDGIVITNLLRDSNGLQIYDSLSISLGSPKKASLFLLDSGIDGIEYPSNTITPQNLLNLNKFDYHEKGSNYVVFDENAVEITSKSQKADKQMVDFIKDSRAQGVSENDIKNFLIGKGFTAQEVDDIMSVEKGASTKTELSEALLPGYDRLMGVISGVIDKSQNRGVAFNKVMDNAMNYLMGSKVYENATNIQQEMLVRDLNKMFDKKEKSAPSVGKILGTIKDITKITLSEKELLKKQIKDLARGAKNANDARTKITQLLSKEIKELKLKGKVTVTQLTNILRRFSKVNMFDENSISNFVDYMTKVFENADYANKIEGVRAKLNQAKKNIRTKIGIADGLYGPLNRLFSINPTMIPDSVLEKYIQIVDMLGERAAVLNLTDKKELIADTMEVLDAIDLQQSVIDDLAYRFENSNNKVFDDNGKLDYQATIQNMIAKGELVLTDVENMNKFKSLIVPKEDKVEMTESEIQAEKYDLISGIDSIVQDIESSNSIDELGTQNERNLAKDLIELVKSKAIDGLTNSQLKNLSKVLENINNGYVSKMTGTMKEDLNAVEDTLLYKESLNKAKLLPFSKLYSKLKSLILKGTTRKSIDEMVRRNPLYFVDQLLGDYKTKNVFNALFDKAAKAEAAYKSDIKRVHNILDKALERVAKSKGLNANQTLISSYKMTTYLVQLEYLSNLGSKQVNKASDYLRETIKFIESEKSQFGERDAKMLQDILDEFEKNGENIDILYNSFNNAEKEAIKEIRDLNDSLKEKAEYTAAIIRGDKISALTNYVHMNVLLESNPSDTQNLSEAADANNNMKPSTKAKSLIERTKGVKPINFNIFSSVERGAKYVLMDFHLTEPIRTARKTINRTLNEMEKDGKIPKEVVKIKNAIDNAFEEVVSNLLNNSIMISSFGDEVVDFLNKNGYRSILAGTGRFANELISNMGFAVIADPKAMATGMSYRNIIMSPDAIKILENVGSKQLARLFHESSLSGRVIDTEILNQAAGIKNSKAKNAVANRIQQIWNLTGKKVPNTVSFIADGLISTPDKLIMRPMWFGSFANQFEKITGEKVDLELIAANDESYMNQYKEAIKESARLADDRSVSAGATDNSFMGILKGAKKPNQKFWVRGFNNFNNFMTKFMIYEYITARTGIMAAMGNGSITRKQGVALLAGVSTRMITYSTLAHYTGTGLVGLIASGLGYDDDEPEVLEKSFLQTLGQSIVSAGTGLVLGRDFGNATKNIINYGLEKVNENYLDALRVGEYDPYKDAIQYTIVPPDKKGVQTGLFDLVKNLGGASGPVLKTADLLVKNMLAEPKKEAGAIQRQSDERNIRIPLEVLGSLGYIPFYKEVRKQAIKNIYGSIQTEIRDAADKKKQKIEMLQGYKNQTDMKKYDPELYETTFGEGSVGYDEREAVKKLKKAERDLKKQLEDIERGYIKPTKESKSSFGSEGLGEPEKRTRKSKSSFGSAGFGGG